MDPGFFANPDLDPDFNNPALDPSVYFFNLP